MRRRETKRITRKMLIQFEKANLYTSALEGKKKEKRQRQDSAEKQPKIEKIVSKKERKANTLASQGEGCYFLCKRDKEFSNRFLTLL